MEEFCCGSDTPMPHVHVADRPKYIHRLLGSSSAMRPGRISDSHSVYEADVEVRENTWSLSYRSPNHITKCILHPFSTTLSSVDHGLQSTLATPSWILYLIFNKDELTLTNRASKGLYPSEWFMDPFPYGVERSHLTGSNSKKLDQGVVYKLRKPWAGASTSWHRCYLFLPTREVQ